MADAYMGAEVIYCGHNGTFLADIFRIENVNVVRASGPVTPDNITRPIQRATHQLMDFPKAGFWRPDLGVFVVPVSQVTKVGEVSETEQDYPKQVSPIPDEAAFGKGKEWEPAIRLGVDTWFNWGGTSIGDRRFLIAIFNAMLSKAPNG